MRLFLDHTKDAIIYAFEDKTALIIICALLAITSLISKNETIPSYLRLITLTLLIVMGYGSYISWYTLKGSDEHPKFRNIKKLAGEGFKKSLITFIYGIGLTFFFHYAKVNFFNKNILFALGCFILFLLIYLFLIGGLLNRYLHRGQFLKAFNIVEIIKLISIFDIRSFIKVIIAVIISQAFAISIVVGFTDGFSFTELIYSISTFFLSPFLYITTKRLVGLNVRDLLENKKS